MEYRAGEMILNRKGRPVIFYGDGKAYDARREPHEPFRIGTLFYEAVPVTDADIEAKTSLVTSPADTPEVAAPTPGSEVRCE